MRKVTVSVQVDAEKMKALQFYMAKKDATVEAELDDFIGKLYEKYVPAQTREYIESMAPLERRRSTASRSAPQPQNAPRRDGGEM